MTICKNIPFCYKNKCTLNHTFDFKTNYNKIKEKIVEIEPNSCLNFEIKENKNKILKNYNTHNFEIIDDYKIVFYYLYMLGAPFYYAPVFLDNILHNVKNNNDLCIYIPEKNVFFHPQKIHLSDSIIILLKNMIEIDHEQRFKKILLCVIDIFFDHILDENNMKNFPMISFIIWKIRSFKYNQRLLFFEEICYIFLKINNLNKFFYYNLGVEIIEHYDNILFKKMNLFLNFKSLKLETSLLSNSKFQTFYI